jgi:dipeptidyl aminopeptidase/acylaminoacyl peptidase
VVVFAALSFCLFGCGEGGSPPADGVALKEGGELAAWSPDGRLIAAPGSGEINLVDPGGSVVRRIRAPGVQHGIWPCECRLGWSRDGDRILFVTRRGAGTKTSSVGSVDRAGGRMRRVPLGVPAGDSTWSPHGWPLVFVVNSGAYEFNTPHRGPRPNLWRLDSLGSKPYPILRQPGTEIRPVFSPDGTKVMYVRKRKGSRDIWVVNADGSNPHPIATRLLFGSAAWAPNSRQIAVAGAVGSQRPTELYLVRASGGDRESVAGVSRLISALGWTPDGHWITYGDLGGTIWRIRPDGSGREQIGEVPDHLIRRLLWSPDGKHLAYAALKNGESGYGAD